MKPSKLWLSLVLLFILYLAACASNGGVGKPAIESQTPDLTTESGLPAVSGLLGGNHAASIAGPADYNLQLDQIWAQQQASYGSGELLLAPGAAPAWTIYQVSGFDGDMFPLSAHVDISDGPDDYYVSFADFDSGRWSVAGPYSGSADVDIVLGSEPNHPHRFISPTGSCFLALISSGPGQLGISRVLLEVFGGSKAPKAPGGLLYSDGGDNITLYWQGSPSEDAPDFANYILERAPFNGSDYVELMRERPAGNSFVDNTVVQGHIYRYRVCAIDSNDNRSTYAYNLAASANAVNGSVVPKLTIPTGPLYGPVDVEFDLSGSYVNGGGVIDTYELYVAGAGTFSSPTSSYTLTLQPGCYRVIGKANSGMKTGSTVRYLRVLPRWSTDTVLVNELSGNLNRLDYARSARLPDGRLVHCGFDPTIGAGCAWVESPAGLQLYINEIGADAAQGSCEPVLIDGTLHFGIVAKGKLYIMSFDGSGLATFLLPLTVDSPYCCLLESADGLLAAIYQVDNGGNKDLQFMQYSGSLSTFNVVLNINGGLKHIDAVYNPTVGGYDICYGDALSLIWEQWEPTAGHIAGGGLYNFQVRSLDLEHNPVSGRTDMLASLDVAPKEAWYMPQDETGFWTLPELVDNGLQCSTGGDLLETGNGPYVFNQVFDGVDDRLRLYARDAGVWSALHDEIPVFNLDDKSSLLSAGGSDFVAGLPLKGGGYAVRSFPQSGSPDELYNIAGDQDGYAGELHATSGADGLHAIWLNRSYGDLEHSFSSDGDNWMDMNASLGQVTDLDLASTLGGEVYLSLVDVNSTELHYWDGLNWVKQLGYPGVAGYRPGLMAQPTNELMYWYVHLQPANSMRFVSGNQSNPFNFIALIPSQPSWLISVLDGGFDFAGVKPRLWALSGASLSLAKLDYREYNYPTTYPLNLSQISNSDRFVWGRTMDSCLYESVAGAKQSVWLTNADGQLGSMLVRTQEQGSQMELRPYPADNVAEQIVNGGSRLRTVDMAMGRGNTALVVEAGRLGSQPRLIWSNFGEFSQLPLPDQLNPERGAHISSPALVVDSQGVWHIIYLDLYANQMRSISTVH